MYRKSFMKMATVLLTAACTVTALPQAAFADELIISEPVLVAEEPVTADGEALVTEDEEVASGDEAATFDEDDILNDGASEAEAFDGNDAAAPEKDDFEADREADPEFKKATSVSLDQKVEGTATKESFKYYKFVPATTGRYYVAGTNNKDMCFRMTDSEKYVTTTDKAYYYHDNRLYHKDNEPFDLIKGKTYYIVVEPEDGKDEVTFDFTISLGFEVTLSRQEEPKEISFGQKYEGHLCYDEFMNTEKGYYSYVNNYYKFTLTKPATFTLNVKDDSNDGSRAYTIYNIVTDLDDVNAYKDYNMAWQWKTHHQSEYGYLNYSTKSANTWLKTTDGSDSAKISLLAGTYYMPIYGSFGTTYDKPLNYEFSITDVKYLEKKGNETIIYDDCINGSNDWYDYLSTDYDEYYDDTQHGPMPIIELNKTYHGILTEDSLKDYYHFTLNSNSPLYLTLETDEWIGEVEVSFLYKKQIGVSSFYFKKSMVASPGAPLPSVKLEATDTDVYKGSGFVKGEYEVFIQAKKVDDGPNKVHRGTTGQYKFMISTGKTGSKPVSSLKLDNKKDNVIALGVGEKTTLTATVGPEGASDTTVNFDVLSTEPGIIEVKQKELAEGETAAPGETKLEITALKEGPAIIAIKTNGVNSKNKPLEATCMVSVIANTVCEQPVAVREKIDLGGETYFNTTEIANTDKFDVISDDPKIKGIGSVSKGQFTAKKAGKVHIIWKKKDGKTYVPKKKITIDLKMPEYKKNDKGKDIKASDTVLKRNTYIDPSDWLLDLDKAETIKPDSFELDAASIKNGLASIDGTGRVTVLKPGNIKVTALYGEGKNASKMVYTIKSKVPYIKDVKAKPNAVKAKAKDKVVTLAVSNLPKSVKLTAADWKIRTAILDEQGNVTGYSDVEPDSEKIKFTAGVKDNYSKATVAVAPGTEPQTVAVIATIDGVEYPGYVTIQ